MLTTDTGSLLEIVGFLRQYHSNPLHPPALVQGMTYVNTGGQFQAVNIPYGTEYMEMGTVQLTIDQFYIAAATTRPGGPIQNFTSVLHSTLANQAYENYSGALESPNLNSNDQKKSAVITMISECSRSTFVFNAITALLNSGLNIPDNASMGLEYAFKHYKATCDDVGFGITAGAAGWRPLIYNDYEHYVEGLPGNTKKADYLVYLRAVNDYIAHAQSI